MNPKEIDQAINSLVREKRLLKESMKRMNNDLEQKEARKRIIRINAEINHLKVKYNESVGDTYDEQKDMDNKSE